MENVLESTLGVVKNVGKCQIRNTRIFMAIRSNIILLPVNVKNLSVPFTYLCSKSMCSLQKNFMV